MIIDKLLSTFAFNFNLRRYSTVKDARRRLLAAIAVDYEIAVTDVAAAENMQSNIKVRRCRLNIRTDVIYVKSAWN